VGVHEASAVDVFFFVLNGLERVGAGVPRAWKRERFGRMMVESGPFLKRFVAAWVVGFAYTALSTSHTFKKSLPGLDYFPASIDFQPS